MNIEKINFTIDSNDFNALKIKIFFVADPCHHYLNLSEANRNTNHQTPPSEPTLCDSRLPKGWYRFVGDAGTKMQTTPVPRDRCGTVKSGWLETAHPSVEDGKVRQNVCFGSLSTDCGGGRSIFVKNCGLYIRTSGASRLSKALLWDRRKVKHKTSQDKKIHN